MRKLITLLAVICLLINSLRAGDEGTLKLESVRFVSLPAGTYISVGITNLTGSPVKAFRATLFMINDFDEANKIVGMEFTGATDIDVDSKSTSHHVIKPKETIYYTFRVVGDRTVEEFWSDKATKFPISKGKFQLKVDKVAPDK